MGIYYDAIDVTTCACELGVVLDIILNWEIVAMFKRM